MESLIRLDNVKKSFGKVGALNGVSLELEHGKEYVIRGASGSGKSTLLYLLGGLDRPTGGEIYIDGRPISRFSDNHLAQYRNQYVGFVFQFHFLLPSMTCLDNILLPAQIGGGATKKIKEIAVELSEHLGVTHCLKKYPYELSGGEQQRINIIRALSLKPKLLLCDEPTGNLDSANTLKVLDLIRQLAETNGATLVVVTHDDQVANKFDNHFLIGDGRLI